MKTIPIQRGGWAAPACFPSPALAVLALILALACPTWGQPATSGPDSSKSADIHAAGPLVAKEMMEELAAEFAKTGKAGSLDYLRIDIPSAAASAMVSGRDMVLTMGRITDKDLNYGSKDGW